MADNLRTDQIMNEWRDQPGPEDREISFRDVLLARGNRAALNEASLGRAYQHFQKIKDRSFAIVTAWKTGADEEHAGTNKANMSRLENYVRSQRLGFFDLKGHWRAAMPDGSTKDTFEPRIFVPGMTYEQAVKVRDDFNQEAVIYAGPETNDEVALIWSNGTVDKIGTFHPNKIAQAYSEVKGKSFTFEGFELLPNCMVEAQLAMTMDRQVL